MSWFTVTVLPLSLAFTTPTSVPATKSRFDISLPPTSILSLEPTMNLKLPSFPTPATSSQPSNPLPHLSSLLRNQDTTAATHPRAIDARTPWSGDDTSETSMWWSTVYTTDYTAPGEPKTSLPGTSTPSATTPLDTPAPPSAILRHSSYPTGSASMFPSAITPASTGPSQAAADSNPSASVVTRLWQPSSNVGNRLRIPRLFFALLSFECVVSAARSYPGLDLTSWTSHTASIFDPPPPHGTPLICPEVLAHCGHTLCYSADAQRFCPGWMNLCGWDEICVEGKADEGEDVAYGCVPLDLEDPEYDSRPTTTEVASDFASVVASSAIATTKETIMSSTTQPARTSPTSTTANASLYKPAGSAGHSLVTPSLSHKLSIFANTVRAGTFPNPIRPECCGDICCTLGQVCTRSSTGLRCWHASKRDSLRNEGELISRNGENGKVESNNEQDKEDGGAAGAGAGGHRGGNHDSKKAIAARPKVPMLLYAVLLLSSFVFAAPLEDNPRTSQPISRSDVVFTSSVQAGSRDDQEGKHDIHGTALNEEEKSVVDINVGGRKGGGGREEGDIGANVALGIPESAAQSQAGWRTPGSWKPVASSASRPPIPILISTLLTLLLFSSATTASFAGTPQGSLLPITSLPMETLTKRWSCHKPMQDCGSQGCWNPATQFCCQQPSGDYGTCKADLGQVCCGTMCCPKEFQCRAQEDYLCVPKETSGGEVLDALEVSHTESRKMIGQLDDSGSASAVNHSGRHGHGSVVNAASQVGTAPGGIAALVPLKLFCIFCFVWL
jgi:hypothetical protein